jgi:hypothetical protein
MGARGVNTVSPTGASRRRATSPSAQDGLRPELGQRGAARLVVGAIDDEHAVEMVEFVLDDPGGRQLEVEAD